VVRALFGGKAACELHALLGAVGLARCGPGRCLGGEVAFVAPLGDAGGELPVAVEGVDGGGGVARPVGVAGEEEAADLGLREAGGGAALLGVDLGLGVGVGLVARARVKGGAGISLT